MIRHGEWRTSWRKPAFPREPLPWPRNGLWAGDDAVESGVHQRAGFACPWFRGAEEKKVIVSQIGRGKDQ